MTRLAVRKVLTIFPHDPSKRIYRYSTVYSKMVHFLPAVGPSTATSTISLLFFTLKKNKKSGNLFWQLWMLWGIKWQDNYRVNAVKRSTKSNKRHWIEQKHWIKQKHWMTKSRTIKTGNEQYRHWTEECLLKRLNCDQTILARIKYLCDYGILTIATPFCLCVSSWGISGRTAEFNFLPAGSLLALWRMIEFLSTPCGLMCNLKSSTSRIP